MKINLGSGFKKIFGFVNVDCDASTDPDYVVDLEKDKLPFDEDSVKEVRAYHVLEHIGPGFFGLLKELYRVCENGAIIDIQVPHFRHDYFYGDPSHIRPITVEMMNRFNAENNMEEQKGTPGTTPFALQLGVDFEMVEHSYKLEPFFENQFKTMPADQIDMMARMYNNVIQEIYMKLKVRK